MAIFDSCAVWCHGVHERFCLIMSWEVFDEFTVGCRIPCYPGVSEQVLRLAMDEVQCRFVSVPNSMRSSGFLHCPRVIVEYTLITVIVASGGLLTIVFVIIMITA